MNIHEKALDGMYSDMDDFETKKMFGPKDNSTSMGGVTITITPNDSAVESPEGMNKGGTVPKPEMEADIHSGYDKGKDPLYEKGEMGMSDGGIVKGETDELSLPPFLRKKKIGG